jgi:hypothetical protein
MLGMNDQKSVEWTTKFQFRRLCAKIISLEWTSIPPWNTRQGPTPMSIACAWVTLFTFKLDLSPKSLISGAQISAEDLRDLWHGKTKCLLTTPQNTLNRYTPNVEYTIWRALRHAPTHMFIACSCVKLFTSKLHFFANLSAILSDVNETFHPLCQIQNLTCSWRRYQPRVNSLCMCEVIHIWSGKSLVSGAQISAADPSEISEISPTAKLNVFWRPPKTPWNAKPQQSKI